MPRGGPSSTGGNMEPMPFVRKWGGKEEVEDAEETGPFPPPPPADFGMAPPPDIKPKLELPYGDSEQEELHKNGGVSEVDENNAWGRRDEKVAREAEFEMGVWPA